MSLSVLRRVLANTLTVLLLAAIFASCNKEEPTTVTIIVKTESGDLVEGALVKLFANPSFPLGDPTRLDKETTTNSSGRAEFDYTEFYKQGQSGFAVLDILCSKDTLVGEDIIKVLEEENNEATVFLLPVE